MDLDKLTTSQLREAAVAFGKQACTEYLEKL
jgi:hypothetical protein